MVLLEREAPRLVGFAAGLAAHGDRLALATAETTVTYEELARRADRVAERLGSTRRLVLLSGTNALDTVVAYLGLLRSGHVPLLVPGSGKVDLRRLHAAFRPDAVLDVGSGGLVVEERRRGTAHELHPDLALLLSTSGSTGAPRVVRLSNANLDANAQAIAEYLAIGADDRAATSLPLHYCYGLSVLHSHLVRGAGVAVTDRSVVDPCFWDLFRTQGCTSFAGVPFTFELLDRIGFEGMSLPTLRYVTQAGGRLAPEVVRRYAALGRRDGWDLVVMYGQTEATARMAYLPPHLAESRPEAIGVPIPGGSFRLEPLDHADPSVGEVVYRGPNVMLGYATDASHLALGREVDELRTGDLGRLAPDGLYEIVGRVSRIAKIAGIRIDLDDVEGELRRLGHDVVCTSDDARLVVTVAADDASGIGAVSQAAAGRAGLPPARVAVAVLDELPRLPNGKPDLERMRTASRHAVVPPAPAAGAPAPCGDVHPGVRALLLEVLRIDGLEGHDTFVSLGGDSLSYVEVAVGLEELVGDLPADWHVTPVRDLVPSPADRRRRGAQVETSIVVRAVAILLVVANHVGTFHVTGGAHTLLAVAGWNFARFERGLGDRVRSVARIAVPSALWLAFAAATVSPRIHLDHVLLVHDWVGDRSAHGGYWFIEALVQLLLGASLLLAVPPVARLVRRHPFGAPLGLAVVGLALRFELLGIPLPEPRDVRPHGVLWLFALGWAAAQARDVRARLVVSALLLVGVPGFFDEPYRDVVVAIGALAVLWVPAVRLPRLLVRPLAHLAAASLAIYLTHWQVYPPVRDALGPWPAYAASLLAGLVAWAAVSALARRAGPWMGRRLARRQPSALPSTDGPAPGKADAAAPA